MERPYETMVVYDGTLPDEEVNREQGKIEEFLKKNAGFEKTDVWGKRQLAYEIKKRKTGNYRLFLYKGEGDVVSQLEKDLRLNDRVLRFLSVVRSDKPAVPVQTAESEEKKENKEETE